MKFFLRDYIISAQKRAIACKGPGYPSSQYYRGVIFSELVHWPLRHIMKDIASQLINPEVSHFMGMPYGVPSSEWVK